MTTACRERERERERENAKVWQVAITYAMQDVHIHTLNPV